MRRAALQPADRDAPEERGAIGGWLAEFPKQVVAEAWHTLAGGAAMLTRMAELMFVEVVRRYTEELSPRTGWLAGLRDPVVAPALAALHERPAHGWTLVELARVAATSRTVLTERFSQAIGPPMQYLTAWRFQLAAEQLAVAARRWRPTSDTTRRRPSAGRSSGRQAMRRRP